MVVGYQKPKCYTLTPSRKKIGKALGRRGYSASAKHAMKDQKIKNAIVNEVGKIVRAEARLICSDNFNSILLNKSPTMLTKFHWGMVYEELKKAAPTLLTILKFCLPKRGMPHADAIAVCVSVLMRKRRSSMSFLQRIVSCILYAGHCSKKVIIIL